MTNETENKPLNNNIENLLQEIKPISETSIADVLQEQQRLKAETIQKFLSSDTQKTEITASERKVIPLLKQLALNPFPDIAQHLPIDKQQEILREFEIPYLLEWTDQYITLGIPVGRKGRKEEVDVLKSYLEDDIDIKTKGGSFE